MWMLRGVSWLGERVEQDVQENSGWDFLSNGLLVRLCGRISQGLGGRHCKWHAAHCDWAMKGNQKRWEFGQPGGGRTLEIALARYEHFGSGSLSPN